MLLELTASGLGDALPGRSEQSNDFVPENNPSKKMPPLLYN